MQKLILVIGIFFLTELSFAQNKKQGVEFVPGSYFDVLEKAKKQNKAVFIEFGVNCGYCVKMKKVVFIDETVGAFYNENFISLIVDESTEIGKDLAERFNVYSYPTYFYLSPNGEIVHIAANYKSSERIIKEGKKALDERVYGPSGVWWNKLKTRNRKTYLLFNTANNAFLNLTDHSDEFSTNNLNLEKLKNLKTDHLEQAAQDIQKSLDIEEYYFNTFVAALINYLANDYKLANAFANKALTGFPHHRGTRNDLLLQIIKRTENEN